MAERDLSERACGGGRGYMKGSARGVSEDVINRHRADLPDALQRNVVCHSGNTDLLDAHLSRRGRASIISTSATCPALNSATISLAIESNVPKPTLVVKNRG